MENAERSFSGSGPAADSRSQARPVRLFHSLAPRLLREVYRREQIPKVARFFLAAAGMRDWFATLRFQLRSHLGEVCEPILATLARRMFERRYDELARHLPQLPARSPHPEDAPPRELALVMAALYLLHRPTAGRHKSDWIFSAVGGPPRSLAEWLHAERLLWPLSPEARWREVTTHLGELLIVLTESLPAHLAHARKILGDICFASGARYGEYARRYFGVPAKPADPAAAAIEILRMSEYIFRVNPEHWGHTDADQRSGYLEGTACPWYSRPGWQPGHCGIFGQFQAGICSVFGLRYHLSSTIPKHGGSTCRVDLKPIPIRLHKADPGSADR